MRRQLCDVNVAYRYVVGNDMLTVPSNPTVSMKAQARAAVAVRPPRPLSFQTLLRRLYDLLAVEFDTMEDFADARFRSPEEMKTVFQECLARVDDATRAMLSTVLAKWVNEPSTPFSVRIMDVLCLKRAPLRQGMETSLQDLLDYLLLVARLEEPFDVRSVVGLVRRLGSSARRQAEDALNGLRSPVETLSAAEVYLQLRRKVRPPLASAAVMTGRYYTMALDDLIDMDDTQLPLQILVSPHGAVTQPMRASVCELLFDAAVNSRWPLKMETFFLATAILDRFLALMPVSHAELITYAFGALTLASKYEEIYSVNLPHLVARYNNAVSVRHILAAESRITATLQVRIGCATISLFADAMLAEQDPPAAPPQRHLAQYLIASLAVHTSFGQYRQSLLAAAAVYVSRVVFSIPTDEPSAPVAATLTAVLQAVEKNKPNASAGTLLLETYAQDSLSGVSKISLTRLLDTRPAPHRAEPTRL